MLFSFFTAIRFVFAAGAIRISVASRSFGDARVETFELTLKTRVRLAGNFVAAVVAIGDSVANFQRGRAVAVAALELARDAFEGRTIFRLVFRKLTIRLTVASERKIFLFHLIKFLLQNFEIF